MPTPNPPATPVLVGQLPAVGGLECLLSSTGVGGTTGLFGDLTSVLGSTLIPLLGACPTTGVTSTTGAS